MNTKVIVNPDKDLVEEIHKKIKENCGHCACAIDFHRDNKCICTEFKQQIKEGILGECHCGLYIVVEDIIVTD